MVQKQSSDRDRGREAVGAGDGGSWCVWFMCCVLLVSSAVVVLVTVSPSSSSSSSFASVRFRLPSVLLPPAANANSKSNSRGYYYIPVADNVTATAVVNLRNNIISTAAKRNDHPSNNSSSPVVKLPSPNHILRERLKRLEKGLARARSAIRKAASSSSGSHRNSSAAHVYRNYAAFFQSYVEMEKRFKVYIYEEGELPMVHHGPCKNIYASEGRFIIEMETGAGGKRFKTGDPHSAHAFFLPFSVTWMVKYLYVPDTFNVTPLQEFASDYVRVISAKYPFWNRTQGADHFMLSCHDWGPHASKGNPFLYNTSMRVLCNANSSEGFNPRKDASLPEIQLFDGDISREIRNPPPANNSRPYLAFFAGGIHGHIRPILLQHWKGRDPDLPVYEYLPKNLDYYTLMLQSKFCLCPSGHEVASPRIVEAIYTECVPVILSDHYVLPFSDVLRWEAFSIKVEISQIPQLKKVLMDVPDDEYMRLKEGLRAVRRHFVLNQPARRFDMFHMILHSVWLRRINLSLGHNR